MAVVDVSGISYFMPILAFLLVFVIVFAVLMKIKFANNLIQLSISFIVATIFVTGFGAVSFLRNVSISFAILIVTGIFLIAVLGMFGEFKGFSNAIGIAFAIIAMIAFLVSGMVVYGNYISPYLPWGNSIGDGSGVGEATEWLYSGRVMGSILLVVVGIIAALVLSSGGKK